MTAAEEIVAIVISVLAVVGFGVLVFCAYSGLESVGRNWRWWLNWLTSGLSFSRCPRCTYPPTVTREGGGWVVTCGHFTEVSPTRRLARFHWERHGRLVRDRSRFVGGRS